MDTLIESLERIRTRDGQTVPQLAKRLGLSDSLLYLLRDGKRRPGEKLYRAIIANIPELEPDVMRYLGNGHDTD